MEWKQFDRWASILIVVAVVLSWSGALASCDDLLSSFNKALADRSIDRVKDVEAKIAIDVVCGARLVEVQRRRAALQLLLAQQIIEREGDSPAYEALIQDADQPDVLWRAAVAVGDLRFRQRKFAAATAAFERALEDIKHDGKTPVSPDLQTIELVVDRANAAKMLAANDLVFVEAVRNRDGTLGGTMSPSIRAFKVNSIPMPIGFETASSKFNSVGERAASELLTALRQQAPSEITLIGHTDERGDAEYNMRLSADRANAVAEYLKRNGITARITTVAKGKSEPTRLGDTTGMTREDIWALNRRVVWQRN